MDLIVVAASSLAPARGAGGLDSRTVRGLARGGSWLPRGQAWHAGSTRLRDWRERSRTGLAILNIVEWLVTPRERDAFGRPLRRDVD